MQKHHDIEVRWVRHGCHDWFFGDVFTEPGSGYASFFAATLFYQVYIKYFISKAYSLPKKKCHQCHWHLVIKWYGILWSIRCCKELLPKKTSCPGCNVPLRQPQPCLLGLNAGSLNVGRYKNPKKRNYDDRWGGRHWHPPQKKTRLLNPKIYGGLVQVIFRISIGWFLGSMLIFRGVWIFTIYWLCPHQALVSGSENMTSTLQLGCRLNPVTILGITWRLWACVHHQIYTCVKGVSVHHFIIQNSIAG